MKIEAMNIKHRFQRYDTLGDWWFKDKGRELIVKVSTLDNPNYEFLIAHHEITEAWLCRQHNITGEEVDRFDSAYEWARKKLKDDPNATARCGCKITETSEPGDDIHAPYYRQHQIATGFERIMAAELGVDWNAYTAACEELYGTY